MKTSYRIMRLLVLFDLPSVSKAEKKSYIKFRKVLLDDGFIMMQYSIYVRMCRNIQDANKHIARVKKLAPQDGNIRIISITERQYEDMILVIGEKSDSEKAIKQDFIIVIDE